MAIKKITDEEIRDAQIQGNLPNRPTQKSLYPDNTLTAEEVKAAFDKLPKLVAARYNELVSAIIGTTNGTLNADNLASMMQTGIREGHTLNDLFKEIANGTLSFLPPIFEDDNNKVLTVENGKWSLKHFAAKEALPYFFIGQSGTIDNDAVFQKILNEKIRLFLLTDEETVVSMTPSALEDDGNILLLSGMLLDEENGKLYQIRILPDRSWYLNECPVSAKPSGIGQDGKSAYEIALEHGFEGSEEEWLASLKAESEILENVSEADEGKVLGVVNGQAKWVEVDTTVSVVGAVLEKVSDDESDIPDNPDIPDVPDVPDNPDVPGDSTIINFTINGKTYQAENGMTFRKWVESPYNTDGYRVNDVGGISPRDSDAILMFYQLVVLSGELIGKNYNYTHEVSKEPEEPGAPINKLFEVVQPQASDVLIEGVHEYTILNKPVIPDSFLKKAYIVNWYDGNGNRYEGITFGQEVGYIRFDGITDSYHGYTRGLGHTFTADFGTGQKINQALWNLLKEHDLATPEEPEEPEEPQEIINQIPLSQNTDGTPFVGENGEKGYKSNTRWDRNTDSETTVSGCGLTGFIPVTSNDKIYVTGFQYDDEIKPIIVLFNSSKEEVLLDSSFTYTGYVWATEENGVWTIDVTKMKSGVAFCRFSALGMTDETILTVNQPIGENVYYSITNQLTNCKNSNPAAKILKGNRYSATLSADSGYTLKSVLITIGGQPVTSSHYDPGTGAITIANVTGDIVITAVAEKDEPVQPEEIINQIPLSQNADGTPFVGENGEKGYKSNTRWDRNTDSETTVSGCGLTGFIPVTSNDKIYVTGFEYNDEIKPIIVLFNSSKEEVLLDSSFTYTGYVWATEENGVWTIDVTKMKSGVAFCRFSALGMTDETILTVNQPIGENSVSYYTGNHEVVPSANE